MDHNPHKILFYAGSAMEEQFGRNEGGEEVENDAEPRPKTKGRRNEESPMLTQWRMTLTTAKRRRKEEP